VLHKLYELCFTYSAIVVGVCRSNKLVHFFLINFYAWLFCTEFLNCHFNLVGLNKSISVCVNLVENSLQLLNHLLWNIVRDRVEHLFIISNLIAVSRFYFMLRGWRMGAMDLLLMLTAFIHSGCYVRCFLSDLLCILGVVRKLVFFLLLPHIEL
jgi:hypothetical protein